MQYIVTRDDSYLEHHGVLGMHWGVRKQRTPFKQRDQFMSYKDYGAKLYTPMMKEMDRVKYGQKGVDRITNRIDNKGYSPAVARGTEQIQRGLKRLGTSILIYDALTGKVEMRARRATTALGRKFVEHQVRKAGATSFSWL